MITNFLKAAQEIGNIKKQEVPLPIAQKMGIVGCLKVGDDLVLRSSLTSPVNYDREMARLIYDHTEFVLKEGEIPTKENFERFCATTSNIDKICLLWGLYKTTYTTLGQRSIKCDKENCKAEFKHEIFLDDLINEDTFTPWDETESFFNFVHRIEVPYEDFTYIFESRLPSIKDNNRLLSNLSVDALQNNLTQTSAIFTRKEQMTLLTKSLSIKRRGMSDNDEVPTTDNMQEMLIAFSSYVPYGVSEDFFKQYRQKFDKYYPKFYTKIKCPECGNEINFQIDLEIEFFRRSLLGRIEGSEEL